MDSSDFIEIIDEIGKRLEGPARHVYELAIRQVYVDLFLTLTLFIGLSVVVVLLTRNLRKHDWDAIDMSFPALMTLVFTAPALLVTFVFLVLSIAAALNPEWAAIKMIARSIVP